MKKLLSLLLAVTLLASLAVIPSAVADEVITLRVWGGVPAEAGPQASIDAFNEASRIRESRPSTSAL